MKRSILAWGLILVLVLSGCGAVSKESGTHSEEWDAAMEPNAESTEPMEDTEETMAGIPGNVPGVETAQAAKLIYRGNLEMETTAFEDAIADLQALVERCGGHVQSSNLSHSGSDYRYAEYVVRIPAEQYRAFFTTAGKLCHVTWQNEETEDVSRVYYDTAGRLKTQKTKLERLQTLLEQAKTMEDMITLESAISETEYAIDALSGELQQYDDLVDYSTVTIGLQEVYQLSSVAEPAENFGDRLVTAFQAGIRNFVELIGNLTVGLAYAWIWILFAIGILVVAFVLRRRWKDVSAEKLPFFRKRQNKKDRQE